MTDRYEEARDVVLGADKLSAAFVQRRLGIGYNEAAGYIERMEREGLVTAPDHVGRRSLVLEPATPWNRNAGRFDAPSSVTPEAMVEDRRGAIVVDADRERESLRGVEPIGVVDGDGEEAGPDRRMWLEFLAQQVAEKFPAADRERLIAAIGEAQDLRAAGTGEARDVAGAHLMEIIERALSLNEQQREIAATKRDLFAFAKSIGFNVAAIRRVVKDLETEAEPRKQLEAEIEVYRHVAGVEGPDFVVALPTPAIPGGPPTRKITARERAYRETLALTHAERGGPNGGIFDD